MPDSEPAKPRTRVHLVYPHGNRISTPDAIGRELGRRLESRYEVVHHNWTDRGVIVPEPGDVLLGHPHPHPATIFRRSLGQRGWRRRLMMSPFSHGDLRQWAFEDRLVDRCDRILAITGPYWIRTLDGSALAHWRPKLIQLDLAIQPADFPRLDRSFAPPGQRKLVYIGHPGRGKGTDYLAAIAATLPGTEFGWIGGGAPAIPRLRPYGYCDFSTADGRELISTFDFVIMAGNADANPTTILEAMAWGLIPICTPTCGWEGPGIASIPRGDVRAAADVLRGLLAAPEADLRSIREANWRQVAGHYTWERFAADVIGAIESDDSPALLPRSLRRRLTIAWFDWTSPHGPIAYGRPRRALNKLRHLAGVARRRLRGGTAA